MSKAVNLVNKALAMLSKADYVNQLYYDQEGGEIEIHQTDPSGYQVGDRCSQESGNFKLADGSEIVVEGGVITDIHKGEEPVEPAANEGEQEVVEAVEGVTEEVQAGYKQPEMMEEEPAVAEAGEPAIEPAAAEGDVVIDEPAAGEFNEGPAPKEMVVEEPAVEAPVGESKEKDLDEYMKLSAKVEELMAERDQMKARIVALEKSNEATLKFQEKTGEVVDLIAENAVSGFKPQARAATPRTSTGKSIFQNAKVSRGL